MRHILLPRAIATGTQRMDDAAAVARLVAPSGRALPLAPRQSGTAVGTIDLTAIAAAADEHLSAATDTQKETGCQIASKSDPLSRPRPTPLQACECVRSDGAETGVAEPHIAEQSRSWRAVNGERWVMRGS